MGKEDVEEKHVKRTQKDYTLDFKLRVVRELETSHISTNAISRKYGIQGESTVSRWLEKYGARDADGNVAALMFRKKRPLSGLEQRNLVLEHELSLLREKLKQKGYKEAFYEVLLNMLERGYRVEIYKGEFYQFNLSSCIRQQNSLTAQFVSFSLANLANMFYPPPIFTIINLCLL